MRKTFGKGIGVSCPGLLLRTVRVGGPQGGPEKGTTQRTVDQFIVPSKGLDPVAYLPAAAALFGQEVPVGQVEFLRKAWSCSLPSPCISDDQGNG